MRVYQRREVLKRRALLYTMDDEFSNFVRSKV